MSAPRFNAFGLGPAFCQRRATMLGLTNVAFALQFELLLDSVAFTAFSKSHKSCFTTWAATSALAPLYLAPLLSLVVAQITSPSGETSRTATRASLTVSVVACESSAAIDRAIAAPAPEPEMEPFPLTTLPLIDPLCPAAAAPTAVLSPIA